MKILYLTPNYAHHIHYINGLYSDNNDIDVITDNIRLHLHRFNLPAIDTGFSSIQGPLIAGFLKSFIYKQGLNSSFKYWVNKFASDRYDQYIYRLAKSKYDIVLAYRNIGSKFMDLFRSNGALWICEEVNSHADVLNMLCARERKRLGFTNYTLPIQPSQVTALVSTYNKSDYILVPSVHVANSFISKGIDPAKLIYNTFGCPNVISAPKKRPNTSKTLSIVAVCQVHYRKGIKYLIDACRDINHSKDISLWCNLNVIGPITSEPGFSINDLPGYVKLLGVKNHHQIKKIFSESDVFVLPSLEEGLAVCLGEALSQGLPVIATRKSGALDLLDNREKRCGRLSGITGISIVEDCASTDIVNSLVDLSDTAKYNLASEMALEIAKANTWLDSTLNLSLTFRGLLS